MVVEKQGDIFDSWATVIGHGVNTFGIMGSGIAKTVRALYPDVYATYHDKCVNEGFAGGIAQLLTVQNFEKRTAGDMRIIANISSQIQPGANAELGLLRDGLIDTLNQMTELGLRSLALPRIGAGIGGLQWDDVLETIKEVSLDFPDIIIEVWEFVQK